MSWNARIKQEQGKRRHLGPPTAMKKVLVHTNPHYDRLLHERVAAVDKDRTEALRRLKWQKQTFVIDTAMKETELRELEMPHMSYLPEIEMKTTVPDVWARRPIVTHRRSSTWMMRELGMEPKSSLERNDNKARYPTLPDSSGEPAGRVQRLRPRSGAQAERHYGSRLPLYGQDHVSRRQQKRLREVTRLQAELNSKNIQEDSRFCKLKDSLVLSNHKDNTMATAVQPKIL